MLSSTGTLGKKFAQRENKLAQCVIELAHLCANWLKLEMWLAMIVQPLVLQFQILLIAMMVSMTKN